MRVIPEPRLVYEQEKIENTDWNICRVLLDDSLQEGTSENCLCCNFKLVCRQEGVCQELKAHEHSWHCLQDWGKRAASRTGPSMSVPAQLSYSPAHWSAHRVCWQTSFSIVMFLVYSRATWSCSWWCYCDVWNPEGLLKCSGWGELAQ